MAPPVERSAITVGRTVFGREFAVFEECVRNQILLHVVEHRASVTAEGTELSLFVVHELIVTLLVTVGIGVAHLRTCFALRVEAVHEATSADIGVDVACAVLAAFLRAVVITRRHLLLADLGPVVDVAAFCGVPAAQRVFVPKVSLQRYKALARAGTAHVLHFGECLVPLLDEVLVLELAVASTFTAHFLADQRFGHKRGTPFCECLVEVCAVVDQRHAENQRRGRRLHVA